MCNDSRVRTIIDDHGLIFLIHILSHLILLKIIHRLRNMLGLCGGLLLMIEHVFIHLRLVMSCLGLWLRLGYHLLLWVLLTSGQRMRFLLLHLLDRDILLALENF